MRQFRRLLAQPPRAASRGAASRGAASRGTASRRACTLGAAWLLSPALLAASLLAAAPARADDLVTFRVLDQLGVTEVEETTTIYINQKLIGSFHLDSATRAQSVTVTLPRAPAYRYAMCGRVSTRDADGHVVEHDVNTSGVLHDVDGREFEAVTDNFERYYMRDRTGDAPQADVQTDQGRVCAPAVS